VRSTSHTGFEHSFVNPRGTGYSNRVSADDQPLGLSECVDKYWDRFQDLRPSLLQKHAGIIALVQEALAAARS